MVHSHAGYHYVCVSVRSTTGLWASSRRCREPRVAAAVDRLEEEAQTAGGDAIGSAVLGRPVPGLERLASRAGLRSTGHCGPLATETFSQILGPTFETEWPSSRKAGCCHRGPQTHPADRVRQSPLASAENSWRTEDAGHHNIGANRLTNSTICSAPIFSDLEDVSSESL